LNNQKNIRLKEVAEAADVSLMTASRALRENTAVAEDTRKHVRQIAEKLGYKINPMARSLRLHRRSSDTSSGNSLALLVGHRNRNPLLKNTPKFYQRVIEGMTQRAKDGGWNLSTFWVYEPGLSQKRLIQILKARGIKGVVLLGISAKELPSDLFTFDIVWVGNLAMPSINPQHNYVGCDAFHSTHLALNQLSQLGYTRAGFCALYHSGHPQNQRIKWAIDIARNNHLFPELYLPPLKKYPTLEGRYRKRVVDWCLKHELQALFCPTSGMVRDLRSVLNERGHSLPVFSLRVNEGTTDVAGMLLPGFQMGETAIEVLLKALRQNNSSKEKNIIGHLCNQRWTAPLPHKMDKEVV
jgi:DNA-binding LacI/PurR family transcriptional regulator